MPGLTSEATYVCSLAGWGREAEGHGDRIGSVPMSTVGSAMTAYHMMPEIPHRNKSFPTSTPDTSSTV